MLTDAAASRDVLMDTRQLHYAARSRGARRCCMLQVNLYTAAAASRFTAAGLATSIKSKEDLPGRVRSGA